MHTTDQKETGGRWMMLVRRKDGQQREAPFLSDLAIVNCFFSVPPCSTHQQSTAVAGCIKCCYTNDPYKDVLAVGHPGGAQDFHGLYGWFNGAGPYKRVICICIHAE